MKQSYNLLFLVAFMFVAIGPVSAQISDVSVYRETVADIHDFPETYPNEGDSAGEYFQETGSFEADLVASWEGGLCRSIHSSNVDVLANTINLSISMAGELSWDSGGEPNVFVSNNLLDLSFYTSSPLNFLVVHLRDGEFSDSAIWLFDESSSDILYYLSAEEEDGSWVGQYNGSGYYRLQIVHRVGTITDSALDSTGSMELEIILSIDDVVATEDKNWNAVKALYR